MRLLIAILTLVASVAHGATYYVATTGSDAYTTAQAQNPATPWATVVKAESVLAAGDTVLIADGSYAADPYLNVNASLASAAVFASQSGIAANVVITSVGNNYNVLHSANNVTYSNLTFQPPASTNINPIRMTAGQNVSFYGCRIVSSNTAVGLNISLSGSGTVSNLTVANCSFLDTGNTASGVQLSVAANQTITNATFKNSDFFVGGYSVLVGNITAGTRGGVFFTNCTMVSTSNIAVSLQKATNFVFSGCNITSGTAQGIYSIAAYPCQTITIDSCTLSGGADGVNLSECWDALVSNSTITGTTNHGALLGRDGNYSAGTATSVTGMITNCTVSCSQGHGILVGANCTNVITIDCSATGYDYGLVVKENDNTTIFRNRIISGTSGGLYIKASTNANCSGNIITGKPGAYCAIIAAGASGNKASSMSVTNNWLVCKGASAYSWPSTVEGTGGICNYNTIFFDTNILSGGSGNVWTNTAATTIEDLRTDWIGHTPAGNDSYSWYGPTLNPGFAQ